MIDREKLIELLDDNVQCGGVLGIDSCDTCSYRYNANCYTLAIVDHLISNGVTVQKWIPVSERLPEDCDVVLCHMGFDTTTMQWDGRSKLWVNLFTDYEVNVVTHWMPLPEPPKECE